MSVGGEGGSPKDDLLHRPYLIKKTTRGVEGVKNRQFWDDIVYGWSLCVNYKKWDKNRQKGPQCLFWIAIVAADQGHN